MIVRPFNFAHVRSKQLEGTKLISYHNRNGARGVKVAITRSIRKGEFGTGIERTKESEDSTFNDIKDSRVAVHFGHREGLQERLVDRQC